MAGEIGETSDPMELVPGSPDSVAATVRSMRSYGDALHQAGAGLKRIDITDGWSGQAGDAFRQAFHGQPDKWLEAGDCFHHAADALDTYCHTLTWAQGQAGDAIRQWNEGQETTARTTLDNARSQLNNAGDTANNTVGTARDKAPEKPGFWSKVGDFFEDAGADIANFTGTVVNVVASDLNAMAHHPEDVVGMALGALGFVGGGLGLAGSGAMDASGVLTAPGLVASAASLGLMGVSAAAMVAGAGDLGRHASGDDNVSLMRTDHTGAGSDEYQPSDGFRGSEYNKDELVEFANGHADDGNPALEGGPRPTRSEIDAALENGKPVRPGNQQDPNSRQEQFDYNGVRVIVNYDMPWRTTTYYTGR